LPPVILKIGNAITVADPNFVLATQSKKKVGKINLKWIRD
jgi:hypothetical protein